MNNRSSAVVRGRTIAALTICAGLACFGGCGTSGLSGARAASEASPAAESASVRLYLPEASGAVVYAGAGVTIDASNTNDGYVMVCCEASETAHKLRVSCGESIYTYDLPGDGSYIAVPCQMGDGTYLLRVMEQVDGDLYAQLFAQEIEVRLELINGPYLYASQYVSFNEGSACVAKSYLLVEGLTGEEAIAKKLYRFVANNIVYDYEKAATVQSGYLPDPDETLETGKGICFDYSALLAAMLRAQGIPAQMVIGVVAPEGVQHAWNRAYVSGAWLFMDATFDGSGHKESDYTPERWY